MVSCLDFLQSELRLWRESGSEWAGACPFCGGHDRFRVSTKTNKWWCRRCSPDDKWQSLPDYLMKRRNWTYPQAARFLEGAQVPEFIAPPSPPPITEEQQEHWETISLECQDSLFSEKGKKVLAWLKNERGLSDDTIIQFRLGCAFPRRGYDAAHVAGTTMPAGVTIPLNAHDGALYGVKIRTNGRNKYRFLPGSRPCLYGPHTPTTDLLVTEGEFDGMLAWQETDAQIDVATVGSGSYPLETHWKGLLIPYRRIFVVHDNDKAGEKSTTWDSVGRAEHVATPSHKDISEYKETGNLRHWLDQTIHAPHVPKPQQRTAYQAEKYAS